MSHPIVALSDVIAIDISTLFMLRRKTHNSTLVRLTDWTDILIPDSIDAICERVERNLKLFAIYGLYEYFFNPHAIERIEFETLTPDKICIAFVVRVGDLERIFISGARRPKNLSQILKGVNSKRRYPIISNE